MTQNRDPLNKLSQLVGNAASQPPGSREAFDDDEGAAEDEKKLLSDAGEVLKFARRLAGKDADIFDVQILIETCADLIRDQIREEATGDEE